MKTYYLGDIHGNFDLIRQYVKMYKITDAIIIQVGDFGSSGHNFEKDKRELEIINEVLAKNNVTLYAIRGNHDYKPFFDNDPFGLTNIKLIKDYTVLDINGQNTLFIGGAVSVDRSRLTKGVNWWIDETVVYDEDKLNTLTNIDIIVTHTAPKYCTINNDVDGYGEFVERMFKVDHDLEEDIIYERELMTHIFDILKANNNIKKHFHGHFHKSDVVYKDGVVHRLLDVGELYRDI